MADPTWGDQKTIEIRIGTGPADKVGIAHQVGARVYGEWAAHPGVLRDNTFASWWAVTHVPSGMAVPQRFAELEAMAIAATLGGRLPSLATAQEVKASLHLIFPAIALINPGIRFK